jgi:acyl dehydratase
VRADGVEVGDTAPLLVVADLERKDFVKFAGATGDFKQMHHDEPAAKEAGYDSVFAPGMLAGGYASRMLANWFGLANIETFSIRFTDQVWPDETLTVTGEVTDVEPTDNGVLVHVDVTVSAEGGRDVVTGTAIASAID